MTDDFKTIPIPEGHELVGATAVKVMDAAERAHKLVTDQGDYTKRRVTLAESAICQAEQAARQDERRKRDELFDKMKEAVEHLPEGAWVQVDEAKAMLSALAEEVTGE